MRRQNRVCLDEGVCPHCGTRAESRMHSSIVNECSMQKQVECTICGSDYIIPYLLVFDENYIEME